MVVEGVGGGVEMRKAAMRRIVSTNVSTLLLI